MKTSIHRIFLSFVISIIIGISSHVYSQCSLISSYAATCSPNGSNTANKAVDCNNETSYYQNGQQYCNFNYVVILSKSIQAAKVRIKCNYAGMDIYLGNSPAPYYRTQQPTDEFYVILPSWFSTITIKNNSDAMRALYDVKVTEVSLASASMPFTYDAAGNMITRKIVLSITKAAEDNSQGQDSIFSDNISNHKMLIYPNPTEGQLRIVMEDLQPEDNAMAEVFNTAGVKVAETLLISGDEIIDLSAQANGMYILVIKVNDEVQQWKIIKQ